MRKKILLIAMAVAFITPAALFADNTITEKTVTAEVQNVQENAPDAGQQAPGSKQRMNKGIKDGRSTEILRKKCAGQPRDKKCEKKKCLQNRQRISGEKGARCHQKATAHHRHAMRGDSTVCRRLRGRHAGLRAQQATPATTATNVSAQP